MEILNKAVSKVGAVANQAAGIAAQRRRIEAEQRALADLRSQAFGLRAQIGEEMFKLWQARRLPPSSLDHLFEAVGQTMAAIEAQRRVVDDLLAQYRASGGTPEPADEAQALGGALPPPPVPAAPTRLLSPGSGPNPVLPPPDAAPAGAVEPPGQADAPQKCPTCGAGVVAGKPYCGFCGTRLS